MSGRWEPAPSSDSASCTRARRSMRRVRRQRRRKSGPRARSTTDMMFCLCARSRAPSIVGFRASDRRQTPGITVRPLDAGDRRSRLRRSFFITSTSHARISSRNSTKDGWSPTRRCPRARLLGASTGSQQRLVACSRSRSRLGATAGRLVGSGFRQRLVDLGSGSRRCGFIYFASSPIRCAGKIPASRR